MLHLIAIIPLILPGSAGKWTPGVPANKLQAKKEEKRPLECAGGAPAAATLPKNAWRILCTVYYTYPPAWEFEELRVELYYHKKNERPRQSSVVMTLPNEMANGTPGQFRAQVDVRAAGANETITAKAFLVAKHPSFGQQEWSLMSPVLTPMK